MRKPRILGLDGIRAISVSFVIYGHLVLAEKGATNWTVLERIFGQFDLGVSLFFGLSGLLITHLLFVEQRETGTISLKKFYLYRTLRILPPFYSYLLVVAFLGMVGIATFSWEDLLAAMTLIMNYQTRVGSLWFSHAWSLCVEEQFYLLWPVVLVFAPRKWSFRICIAIILLAPISRILTYQFLPQYRERLNYLFHTRVDSLMIGALVAHLQNSKFGFMLFNLAEKYFIHWLSLLYLFILVPIATPYLPNWYHWTFGLSFQTLAIGIILAWILNRPVSSLISVLEFPLFKHIGVISYSLYLWQQPVTGRLFSALVQFPMGSVVLIFLCAELSHWLIEKPVLRLREKFYKFTPKFPPITSLST